MSDVLWVVDYYVTYVVRVNIPVVNRSSVICRRHNSSVLRSLVNNCADRYVKRRKVLYICLCVVFLLTLIVVVR
jgi:hypothetical protein